MDECVILDVPISSPDALRLIHLLDKELSESYPPEHRFTVDIASFTEDGGTFLVAFVTDEPVACGAIRPIDNQCVEIKRMFVVPDFRGRGLSRKILESLEQRALQSGFRRIVLETGDDQKAAINLYSSSGYDMIEPFGPYRFSPRSVCFGKRLFHTI